MLRADLSKLIDVFCPIDSAPINGLMEMAEPSLLKIGAKAASGTELAWFVVAARVVLEGLLTFMEMFVTCGHY